MRLPSAVLFDIDGTLVDSNYLHVDAWQSAFRECGIDVPAWRIHRLIGLDSDLLLDQLAPEGSDRGRLSDLNSRAYLARTAELRAFAGARDLLNALAKAGIVVALATSAPRAELDILLRVLDLDDAPITTDADDVEQAKPHPGIVEIALRRAGVDAADAVFVGDATWDMEAAHRAGLTTIAVRSGGIGDAELSAAGAATIVDDIDAVRRGWDLRPNGPPLPGSAAT